jgi:hypothetical protein
MSQERTLDGSSALRRYPQNDVAVALAGAAQRLEQVACRVRRSIA